MLTYVFSALALAASLASLWVSVLTYRTSGPRVEVGGHSFFFTAYEAWLQVKIVNSGKGEVDIDGATCDLLGPTVNVLPYRLRSAASHIVAFRAPLHAGLLRSGSVTVNVGLGNGRSLTSQLRMTERQLAELGMHLSALEELGYERAAMGSSWRPPIQEEL